VAGHHHICWRARTPEYTRPWPTQNHHLQQTTMPVTQRMFHHPARRGQRHRRMGTRCLLHRDPGSGPSASTLAQPVKSNGDSPSRR